MARVVSSLSILALLLLLAGPAAPQTAMPSVSAVTPATALRGTEFNAFLTGSNLSTVSTIVVSGTGVTFTALSGGTADRLPVLVRVEASAAFGARTVWVTGRGPATSVPCDCFTVRIGGNWRSAGAMGAPRYLHTATTLASGKILVAGGLDAAGSPIASAEIYDPAAGTWSATRAMIAARFDHTATLLGNGKVLVVGGRNEPGRSLAFAEVYDPESGTWTATGSLGISRAAHTATLLRDGRVLAAGGNTAESARSAELYDPVSGAWSATGNPVTGRWAHAATLLPEGRVLATGGATPTSAFTLSTEIYEPATGLWSSARPMRSARHSHRAVLVDGGRLVVIGGTGPTPSVGSQIELLELQTDTWSLAATMNAGRFGGHAVAVLPSGEVVIAGDGGDGTSGEVFAPSAGAAGPTVSLAAGRFGATASALPNGNVLVAGGASFRSGSRSVTATTEQFSYVPHVTNLTPGSGAPGSTFPSVLRGRYLRGTTAVVFGGGGVTADVLRSTDDEVQLNITIATTAVAGVRRVTVRHPEGASQAADAFVVTRSGADQEFSTIVDAGYYTAEITLQPGERAGYWGIEVVTTGGILSGGLNMGGGFDRLTPGFGGFRIDAGRLLTAAITSQPLPGEPSPLLTLRLLDQARQPVFSVDVGGSATLTQSLPAGFYTMEVAGRSGRGAYQLALGADYFTNGVVVGGLVAPGLPGFGGFNLPEPQDIRIRVFRTAYGAVAAGAVRVRLIDSQGRDVPLIPR